MNTDQKEKMPLRPECEAFKYDQLELKASQFRLNLMIELALNYDTVEYTDCDYLYKEIDKLISHYYQWINQNTA